MNLLHDSQYYWLVQTVIVKQKYSQSDIKRDVQYCPFDIDKAISKIIKQSSYLQSACSNCFWFTSSSGNKASPNGKCACMWSAVENFIYMYVHVHCSILVVLILSHL